MKPRLLYITAVLFCISSSFVVECKSFSKREDDPSTEAKQKLAGKLNMVQKPIQSVASAMNSLSAASASPYSIVNKLQQFLGKLGPVVMVASIAISIITAFLPQPDSKELAFMKEKFDVVINGLTRIESKISDLEQVVIHENTKTAFSGYQRSILNLYEDWNSTINAKTPQLEMRNRAFFVKQYELHYQHAALNLLRSMTGFYDGELNNDLLKTATERYKCDGLKIRKLCVSVTQTILQGLALEGAYYSYVELFDRAEGAQERWQPRLELLSRKCEDTIDTCSNKWKDYMVAPINQVFDQYKTSSNEILAQNVYNMVTNNFAQRAWFVFVYDTVLGFQYHAYKVKYDPMNDEVIKRWRENGKMLTVISFDTDKNSYFRRKEDIAKNLEWQKEKVESCIAKLPGLQEVESAKILLAMMTTGGEDVGLYAYAIKSGLNLSFYGAPGRYNSVIINVPETCQMYRNLNYHLFTIG